MRWQDSGRAGLCGGWFRSRKGSDPEVAGLCGNVTAFTGNNKTGEDMEKTDKIVKSNKLSGGRIVRWIVASYAKYGCWWMALLGVAVGVWVGYWVAPHLVWVDDISDLSVEIETDDSDSDQSDSYRLTEDEPGEFRG